MQKLNPVLPGEHDRCHNSEWRLNNFQTMRCAVSSSSGQVLAMGYLFIAADETGAPRLCFRTDRGRVVQGGIISPDGDLTDASQELFRGFFQAWGMTGLTLTARAS